MKLKFNGITEKRSKGCPVCGGGGRKTDIAFRTTKTFILPSGVTKTFRAGKIEEVSEEDGDFLLSYNYTLNGVTKPSFEVVS